MANGKYIGPEDVAEIKATIVQMLAAGTPRSEIVTALAARYVPHDDLARMVARMPTADDARRYKPMRIGLMVLMLVCLILYVIILLMLVIVFVRNPTSRFFGSSILACILIVPLTVMPGMVLVQLKNDDGMAYPLGFFSAILMVGNSLYADSSNGFAVAISLIFVVIGAIIGIASFVVWRKFFPDVRLINPPPKDATGAYVFKRDTPAP